MTDLCCSQTLIDALRDPSRYPHPAKSVRLLETHISWVLLAGRYAYKIKKPVDLGFLNFTELNQRHFYCQEEIRLNRRLAPKLYLEATPIGGSPQQPIFGAEPAFEYAVRMRRFSNTKLADYLAGQGKLNAQHIDRLAKILARFHDTQPPAPAESPYGTPEAIAIPVRHNFEQIGALLDDKSTLTKLKDASEQEYRRCIPLFEQRRQKGFIRECHGDLHLGNIVVHGEEPTPFDGIEFDPNLRWIDTINDIAFLIMDLQHRGRPDLAFRFLNAYLEASGDYAGLGILRFYLAYRAVVRAKIAAIRSSQTASKIINEEYRSYMALAARNLAKGRAILVVTHGLPGCGKTTVSQIALERLLAIRIRSDIERKRLFGLAANDSSDGTIYAPDATRQTYDRLLQLSRELLSFGFPVIVDAAFLKHSERQQFQMLATEMKLPFAILSIQAETSSLRRRIQERLAQANDASEADLGVLEKLQLAAEPLRADELENTITVVNNGDITDLAKQISSCERLTPPKEE